MVFLVIGRSVENIEEKKKTDTRKTMKNEEYEESQIISINIFGFTFYIQKLYFAWKHSLKKPNLYYRILFTVFMRCRIFETQ